ncbi:MAG: hypothetical protein D6744_17240 [Planctomycetota bacterium]|nr:MAG: hypothetical protein D6744_17240 [Planctomycetota bacterium]
MNLMLRTLGLFLMFHAVAVCGCEPAAPPAPPAAEKPTDRPPPAGAPASQRAPLKLTDWVLHPYVAAGEENTAPLRIVSGAPNVTEMICALGGRESLVGRTRYCEYPPGIDSVPSIGALVDVNVEALLALKPDAIIIPGESRAQVEALGPLGFELKSVPDTTLEDLFRAIRRVGEVLGRRRSSKQLCERIAAELEAVDRRFAGSPSRRVLIVIGTLADPPAPPFVAGPKSFYDDLLRRAGHTNAAPPTNKEFAALSLEYILSSNPDVIIELDAEGRARPRGDEDARAAWARLGALAAVENRRVHVLTGRRNLLLGPRIAFVYADLCRAINGERVADAD